MWLIAIIDGAFSITILCFILDDLYSKRESKIVEERINTNEVKEILDKLSADMADVLSPVPYIMGTDNSLKCKVCDSLVSKFHDDDDLNMCNNLRDIFPHKINQEPPISNPYRYFWHQVHGYDPTYKDKNDTDGMQASGVKYWMDHNNWAWNSGYRPAPDWYIRYSLLKLNSPEGLIK